MFLVFLTLTKISLCPNTNQLYRFEKDLKQKLILKSTSHITEEGVLLKAFKYFDLNNSGTVNKKQFVATLEKIGLAIDNQEVPSQILFFTLALHISLTEEKKKSNVIADAIRFEAREWVRRVKDQFKIKKKRFFFLWQQQKRHQSGLENASCAHNFNLFL